MLDKIAQDIASIGGRAFYTGGYVRDLFLSLPNNGDVDIEVFNLDEEKLISILKKYGQVKKVGKIFPTIKIKGYPHLDFTLPPST